MSNNYLFRCKGGNPAVDAEMECPVELLPRFGGWTIGRSAECQLVLPCRSVELLHVCLEDTEEAGKLRLVHLKTGRVSSVHDDRKRNLPVGESCELTLPCVIWVADVKISISIV